MQTQPYLVKALIYETRNHPTRWPFPRGHIFWAQTPRGAMRKARKYIAKRGFPINPRNSDLWVYESYQGDDTWLITLATWGVLLDPQQYRWAIGPFRAALVENVDISCEEVYESVFEKMEEKMLEPDDDLPYLDDDLLGDNFFDDQMEEEILEPIYWAMEE